MCTKINTENVNMGQQFIIPPCKFPNYNIFNTEIKNDENKKMQTVIPPRMQTVTLTNEQLNESINTVIKQNERIEQQLPELSIDYIRKHLYIPLILNEKHGRITYNEVNNYINRYKIGDYVYIYIKEKQKKEYYAVTGYAALINKAPTYKYGHIGILDFDSFTNEEHKQQIIQKLISTFPSIHIEQSTHGLHVWVLNDLTVNFEYKKNNHVKELYLDNIPIDFINNSNPDKMQTITIPPTNNIYKDISGNFNTLPTVKASEVIQLLGITGELKDKAPQDNEITDEDVYNRLLNANIANEVIDILIQTVNNYIALSLRFHNYLMDLNSGELQYYVFINFIEQYLSCADIYKQQILRQKLDNNKTSKCTQEYKDIQPMINYFIGAVNRYNKDQAYRFKQLLISGLVRTSNSLKIEPFATYSLEHIPRVYTSTVSFISLFSGCFRFDTNAKMVYINHYDGVEIMKMKEFKEWVNIAYEITETAIDPECHKKDKKKVTKPKAFNILKEYTDSLKVNGYEFYTEDKTKISIYPGLPYGVDHTFIDKLMGLTPTVTPEVKQELNETLEAFVTYTFGGNREVFDWHLKTIKYKQMNKFKTSCTALILTGDQGCGKSLYSKMIGELFGHKYYKVCKFQDIIREHSTVLLNCCVCVINELPNIKNKNVMDYFKDNIDGGYTVIKPLYNCEIYQGNITDYIICSNNINPIKYDEDDRRYVQTSGRTYCDSVKFKIPDRVYQFLKYDIPYDPFMSALQQYINSLDITGFIPNRDMPINNFKYIMINSTQEYTIGGFIKQYYKQLTAEYGVHGIDIKKWLKQFINEAMNENRDIEYDTLYSELRKYCINEPNGDLKRFNIDGHRIRRYKLNEDAEIKYKPDDTEGWIEEEEEAVIASLP